MQLTRPALQVSSSLREAACPRVSHAGEAGSSQHCGADSSVNAHPVRPPVSGLSLTRSLLADPSLQSPVSLSPAHTRPFSPFLLPPWAQTPFMHKRIPLSCAVPSERACQPSSPPLSAGPMCPIPSPARGACNPASASPNPPGMSYLDQAGI